MPVVFIPALALALFAAFAGPAQAAPQKQAPEKPPAVAASEPSLDVRDPQFAEKYAARYRAAMSAKPAATR